MLPGSRSDIKKHTPSVQAIELPPEIEPLVLWEPAENQPGSPVEVDSMLTQFLRPHQREGVQFMFECVAGMRPHNGQGAFPRLCSTISKIWLDNRSRQCSGSAFDVWNIGDHKPLKLECEACISSTFGIKVILLEGWTGSPCTEIAFFMLLLTRVLRKAVLRHSSKSTEPFGTSL